jgi:AAA domain/TrwC relaxase
MQSTHKVPGSSATRWSKYLISEASRGDYYTHDGHGSKSSPTRWHGPVKLLESFGIDPRRAVELRHLRPLMHGFDPITGEALRPAGADKTRVAAIDLAYAPPKEVSALWATADPYRRAQLEVAHRNAVKSALERIEREVRLVRRKTGGVVRFEQAKGLLAMEAVHTTSRLGKDQDAHGIPDPQLHSKAYECSAGVCRPAEADELVNDLARSGELLQLEDGTWTTRQLRELEQETIDIVERRASEVAAPVSEQALKQARHEIGREINGSLTQEQCEALDTITGPGGIAVLVGPAGTGKGVVISTAARAWQLEGDEVIGIAVAGQVAQRLQNEASLDSSYSADELNYGIRQGRIRIGPDTVVVFDEAAMADHDRIAPLVKLTAEHGAKPLLVGDAAQLSTIGPGGLFAALEGRVPTAELHEVHRANHKWERNAWEQIRAGEPGPPLAQYHAHDRLHIHDTRAEAAEAMVKNWDETRKSLPGGRAGMITDASNLERDQMNAIAQERRVRAGELGAHQVDLPGKPYGLRAGDEIIFSAKFPVPGEDRIKNGVTGTVIDASHRKDKVTIRTNEHEPREVQVDTSKFSELALSYAVHVNKGQGITAETSGILIGGWQTDKEHAYVTVSRAREETQIYVSREDLGEHGLDTGAIERLAEKMKRSRAQEATVTKRVAQDRREAPERSTEHPAQIEPTTQATPERIVEQPKEIEPTTQATSERSTEQPTEIEPATQATPDRNHEQRVQVESAVQATPDRTVERPEPGGSTEASQQHEPPARTAEPAVQDSTETPSPTPPSTSQGTESELVEALKARRARQFEWERAIDVDRSGNAGEQAREAEAIEHLAEQLRAEGATEATVTKEIAKQTAGRAADVERNTQAQAEHERHIDKILRKQRQRLLASEITREIDRDRDAGRDRDAEQAKDADPKQAGRDAAPEHAEQAEQAGRDPEQAERAEKAERDPYIEQAIRAARDRQQAWEQGIDQDRANDRGFGIE